MRQQSFAVRFKPICSELFNKIFTVGALALWCLYMTYYKTNWVFILGLFFPLENAIFLMLSEKNQISFLKVRVFSIYLWYLVVLSLGMFHFVTCLHMMQSATKYGEDMGFTNIKFHTGPLLQL